MATDPRIPVIQQRLDDVLRELRSETGPRRQVLIRKFDDIHRYLTMLQGD